MLLQFLLCLLKSINAKTETVGGALTLGKRAPPTYAPSRMRTEKKEECVLTARMLPEAARPPPAPTFFLPPSRNWHSQKTLEQEVKRTPKINKPTPTQ